MKICLLTTSTTAHRMGGTEVQAETLAAETARQGHQVFIVTTAHPRGIAEETRNGYRVIYLSGTSHEMSRKDAPVWWSASASRTAELCETEGIDIVWAENFSGLSYAAIPARQRKPVLSIVQGLAVRGEVISNFNRISTAGELLYLLTRYAAQTLFYYIPRFRALARDSDLLVGVSNETVAALEAEYPGSGKKTIAIFNPVDTERFRPAPELRRTGRERLGLPDGAVTVLMSGVLHKQKGMHLGLLAFAQVAARFPQARLIIAGDGPEKQRLAALAGELGIAARVTFPGLVPNEEMPLHYNSADIYLNPTLRMEGLGIVNVEAMACGLPVITSKIGGTGSSIEDGKSGFFTRPGDISGLAGRLEQLLGDPALRARLGADARSRAEAVFSKETVTRRYIEVSASLLGGRA
ncbi:MAG: glycosyltransferase family 4 protein [Elusimicrobiales bacterium]